jgi:hypothetical protein
LSASDRVATHGVVKFQDEYVLKLILVILSQMFSRPWICLHKVMNYFIFYRYFQYVLISDKVISNIELNDNIKNRYVDDSRYNIVEIRRKNLLII